MLGPLEALLRQQVRQGLGNDVITHHEFPVTANEAEEAAELHGRGSRRPAQNGLRLLDATRAAVLGDDMAQELDVVVSERALEHLGVALVSAQKTQHHRQMLDVVL